jgi:hypothetical protein
MAYTITLTDGTVFATIADGTINTNSSMTLVGKNYAGYGDFLNENYIHLLESGSNTTAPSAPLTGQLWWDKTNSLLKVYNGSIFKTISAATSSSTAPVSNVTGDLWYDTTNAQLKVWTGSTFIVVGPAFSSSQGTSGAIPETITDSVGATKFITSIYVNNNRVAIAYDGAQFVPQSSLLSTFPIIYPGITLTTTNSAIFAGTANNASNLNSLPSSSFMRTNANTSTTGTLNVLNNTGLTVGGTNAISMSQSTNDGLIRSSISGANLVIQSNVGGTIFNVASALGTGVFAVSNAATVGTTLVVTGNASGGNINTAGLVSATGNVNGGNINGIALVTGATVSATGNVNANNVSASNVITAGATISAAGNITAGSGAFFLGNGSQLTGLSAAISVTQIQNGTSQVQIGASGGNANVTIGGTSNVVVFTNSTTFFAGNVSVPGIEKTGSNAVGNIGSSSNYFNRVFATATTALYADVAERFEADELLAPGTVVELGGTKEITRAKNDLTETVFGVISTQPAYTMNGGAGDDTTHPAVAMTGRVPVQVTGSVRKGDRLVSAGNGVARSAQPGEATAFNVIGRALVDKLDPGQGAIEAIVTIK